MSLSPAIGVNTAPSDWHRTPSTTGTAPLDWHRTALTTGTAGSMPSAPLPSLASATGYHNGRNSTVAEKTMEQMNLLYYPGESTFHETKRHASLRSLIKFVLILTVALVVILGLLEAGAKAEENGKLIEDSGKLIEDSIEEVAAVEEYVEQWGRRWAEGQGQSHGQASVSQGPPSTSSAMKRIVVGPMSTASAGRMPPPAAARPGLTKVVLTPDLEPAARPRADPRPIPDSDAMPLLERPSRLDLRRGAREYALQVDSVDRRVDDAMVHRPIARAPVLSTPHRRLERVTKPGLTRDVVHADSRPFDAMR